MDELIFIVLIGMDDCYQVIFGNVIEILVIGSIFCAGDIKLAVYFSLTMNFLIIVFLFDVFYNNSTIWIISTTTTTVTVYFVFFYFSTTTLITNNYFDQCARLRDGSWSGHGCQHFLSRAPLNLQMKGAQDTFCNICDSCNRLISINKTKTRVTKPVTTKSKKNESNERDSQLVNYLLIIFTFTTIILCIFIDYFVPTMILITITITTNCCTSGNFDSYFQARQC